MMLNRALIRTRLAAAPQTPLSDVELRERLMAEGNLETFDEFAKFGSFLPTTRTFPPEGAPKVPAAVLVPLIEHNDGFTVLLTRRTDHLSRHAGQVAFPGGRMDPEDVDAIACALRESREEIGLRPSTVEILGQLRAYGTVTGYQVTPVVGAIRPPLSLQPDPAEVADVFEVPLDFLLDAANHRRMVRDFEGTPAAYYAMPYGDRYIWGATAAMLMSLYHALALPTQAQAV